MITFIVCILVLISGYFIYGKIADKVFGTNENNTTIALSDTDGVDTIPLPKWKAYLIQFLNIAGTGPIFGAIAGAMWGADAFIWITFGCIFGGAIHDFFIGMISMRSKGSSIVDIVGTYLGKRARKLVLIFTVILLLLVGVVFISTPADLLAALTGQNRWIFVSIIFLYFIFATVLPIDKLIAKIYPVFAFVLCFMAIAITASMAAKGYIAKIPEFGFSNPHVEGKSVFPYLFISIACGAISGFHATQTPIMSRCIRNEKDGRMVFFGAMVTEGIVAMIWAAAAMTFFGGLSGLAAEGGKAAVIVNKISSGLLGPLGMVLAVVGVGICPISSGDTAFRSLRLIIAEALHINQKKAVNRYKTILPIFAISVVLLFIDFNVIWRYFSWANQTLATIALWAITVYLMQRNKPYFISLIPAMFMTTVITCYIMVAPEGLYGFITKFVDVKTAEMIGTLIGVAFSVALCIIMIRKKRPHISSQKT